MSLARSISSLQASLASLIRWLVSGKAVPTSETSGLKYAGLSGMRAPSGSWLRTYQDYLQPTLDGSFQELSLTWTRWGIVSDGQYTGLVRSVRHTNEIASSSWRTPQAADERSSREQAGHTMNLMHQVQVCAWRTPTASESPARSSISPVGSAVRLSQQVFAHGAILRAWPTPVAQDSQNSMLPPSQAVRDTLPGELVRQASQGQLNPAWVETLMGLPPGWTDIGGPLPPAKSKKTGNHRAPSPNELPIIASV